MNKMVNCERCAYCDELAEVDDMILIANSDGTFMFCSLECSEDWEEGERKKNMIHFCVKCKKEFKSEKDIHWETAYCPKCDVVLGDKE